MTGVRIRDFAAGDVRPVADLEAAIFGDPWSAVAFRDLLALAHIHGLVAEIPGGSVVGYALCSVAADEGEILNLAVAEGARGAGIGTDLLNASLGWLAGRGAATVFLEVRRSNTAAIAMYEAAGFATVSVRKGYYRMPTEDAIVMTLGLGAGSAWKR
jgi:[ribosomal protein S18]-alanine N-acetyltransferase